MKQSRYTNRLESSSSQQPCSIAHIPPSWAHMAARTNPAIGVQRCHKSSVRQVHVIEVSRVNPGLYALCCKDIITWPTSQEYRISGCEKDRLCPCMPAKAEWDPVSVEHSTDQLSPRRLKSEAHLQLAASSPLAGPQRGKIGARGRDKNAAGNGTGRRCRHADASCRQLHASSREEGHARQTVSVVHPSLRAHHIRRVRVYLHKESVVVRWNRYIMPHVTSDSAYQVPCEIHLMLTCWHSVICLPCTKCHLLFPKL